jgi:hypothetical protein
MTLLPEACIDAVPIAPAGQRARARLGIEVGATAGGGTITGNLFDNMAAAVVLQKVSSGGNVQSNESSNDPVTVSNLGSGNRVGGGSP